MHKHDVYMRASDEYNNDIIFYIREWARREGKKCIMFYDRRVASARNVNATTMHTVLTGTGEKHDEKKNARCCV